MNGNKKKFFKVTAVIIVALVCTGALLSALWKEGCFLPGWIAWENRNVSDSSGQYEIILRGKKAEIVYDSNVIWTSPEDVKVQDALSGDIDSDRKDELILLCWKIGRYGKSRPFWVEEDEREWSQHIFVYEYDGAGIKPKWMSSYIGQDVAEISLYGRNTGSCMEQETGDSLADVLLLTSPGREITAWVWGSWGFVREDMEVSFVVFGDNLIHEPIYRYGLLNDGDFQFLFENMEDVVKGSDIAVLNQETPLTDKPSRYSSYPRFGTPVQVGEAVANAGFDVVTCSTNHIFDQGTEGVEFTKDFFEAHGIECLGIQTSAEKEYRPYVLLTRKGIRFALLNYTYPADTIATPVGKTHMVHTLDDEKRVREDIGRAKSESDFVIVFVHWGTEYEDRPDGFQKKWAQVFLESKADVVVGAHPHVLQPYEIMQDDSEHEMLIYYSVGNYISAQPEKSCVKGGMAEFTVALTPDGCRVTEYGLRPLQITWQEDRRCTVDFYEDS